MGSPLMTPEEIAEWDAKATAAKVWRDTDDVMRPEGPRPYNKTVNGRVYEVERARRWAWLAKMRARPEDILSILLIAFYEKGSDPIHYSDVFEGNVDDRLKVADNPTTRAHVHAVLSGLQIVPRSWATSATTRFFRGIGKQGKAPWSEKPGAGILSKDHGWTTTQASWFIGFFFGHRWGGVSIGDLFTTDDSPDCYGEEAGEVYDEGGNPFAATRVERDEDFYASLTGILEARGLGDIPQAQVKVAKPRKVKVWDIGDKVTSRNLRDLPENAILEWRRVEKQWDRKLGPDCYTLTTRWYRLVFCGRPETGKIYMRPVVKDVAFGKKRTRSTAFYKEGGWRDIEVEATYQGLWDGQVMDVEITDKAWKVSKRSKIIKMQRLRIEDDAGKFIRWDEVQI